MSHYAVAVFTDGSKDVEELLAPYDENLDFPHYIPKTKIIEDIRDSIERFKNSTYAEYLKDPNGYVKKCGHNQEHINYVTKEFPEKLKWTDEECYLEGIKFVDEENIQADGSVFSTYNQNSKWDWYTIGGRFSDMIPLVDGGFENEALMEDVNTDFVDKKAYDEAIRFWQLYVEGQEPVTDSDKEILAYPLYYKKEYYTSHYKSAEDYASDRAGFGFYAALLPTGEWREPGEMGWWGISNASADDSKKWRKEMKKILKRAKENNWYMTIVDCHI